MNYLYSNDDLFKKKDIEFIKGTLLGLSNGNMLTISSSNPKQTKYHMPEHLRQKNMITLKSKNLQKTMLIQSEIEKHQKKYNETIITDQHETEIYHGGDTEKREKEVKLARLYLNDD